MRFVLELKCFHGFKISAGNYQDEMQSIEECEDGLVCIEMEATVEVKITNFFMTGKMTVLVYLFLRVWLNFL